MHSPSATEPAAPVFCTRGGAPPGQIPRFTFQEQFATTSLLKKEFLVVFWRSTYFYFEAHNLLRHPKFSSTKLKKKKKMKIDSTSSKIPSGQVVRLATGLLHVLTQSYQQWEAIQPASNQTVPISFRWIWNQQSWNPTTAFPIMRSRSWHGERAGEIILLPTLSVLNGGVHCPRNPTQIWTLHQPSL